MLVTQEDDFITMVGDVPPREDVVITSTPGDTPSRSENVAVTSAPVDVSPRSKDVVTTSIPIGVPQITKGVVLITTPFASDSDVDENLVCPLYEALHN